ncbi:MAG: YkgJ family cysteine cluster protein [Candidatus Hadarchaeales archaeon]
MVLDVRAPKNVKFECQRCARCCGDSSHRGRIIYLLEEEVERISQYTGLSPLEFAMPISGLKNFKYKMKKRSGVCVFLKDKACRIYDIRPISCSIYPFEVRRSNGAFVFEPSKECPGVGLGCPVAESEFRKMAENAKKIFD